MTTTRLPVVPENAPALIRRSIEGQRSVILQGYCPNCDERIGEPPVPKRGEAVIVDFYHQKGCLSAPGSLEMLMSTWRLLQESVAKGSLVGVEHRDVIRDMLNGNLL